MTGTDVIWTVTDGSSPPIVHSSHSLAHAGTIGTQIVPLSLSKRREKRGKEGVGKTASLQSRVSQILDSKILRPPPQ